MKHSRKHWLLRLTLYTALVSILAPLGVLAVWSFAGRWPWPALLPETYSLRGWEELLGPYSTALPLLISSMGLSLLVGILTAIIGAMTARALTFYDFPGKHLISFGSILPIIVPGTVFAMGVHVIFIRMGLADTYLGVILTHLICALPYTVNIMTDLTRAAGKKLEEQAAVLGAPPLRAFATASLPLLVPGLLSSVSMGYITSFSQYFLTLMIGGGNVKTFSVVMVPYIQGGDRTIASAYSLVFVLSSVLVFILFEFCIKKLFLRGESYGIIR